MKIGLSAETTIDLTKELLEQFDIHIVPFSVILGDEAKLDGEITNEEIYNYVKEHNQLPKTSAVNQFQYEEHFKKLLETYDVIIHFSLSSEMSSAYRNACLAAREFEGKVYVVDSRTLSTAIALEAIYCSELIKQGLPVEEIVKKVVDRVPHAQASFVLKQLDYLYKGGRCSKLAMFGANLFHICPQIVVKDGKMDSGKKYRGLYNKVILNYVDDTLEEFNHPDLNHVFITYSSPDEDQNVINEIENKLKAKGFKNIYKTVAGGTISCHCGPNTLGILYFND